MNRNEQFLSLIGLCLRGRNLEVGEEPVEAVARARDARVLLLASDAADNTARRVQHFAEAGQCVWLRIPFTKQELGQATGRGSAAVAAITDIGLAVAVVRRLTEMGSLFFLTGIARDYNNVPAEFFKSAARPDMVRFSSILRKHRTEPERRQPL